MTRIRAAILGVALLAAACSPSREAAPPVETPASVGSQVCDLLSPAEIGDAVGGPVEPGAVASGVACSWTGAPGAVSAALTVVPAADAATCVGQRPERAEPVKGIGLDTWWDLNETGLTVGTLTVCLDGANMTLTLTGGADPPALRLAAEQLASLAISRR